MSQSPTVKPDRCELHSHADTAVLLDPLDSITTFANIAPFSDAYSSMKDVPIACCATAWTDPMDGVTYVLVFGQALYFGKQLTPAQFDLS